VHSPAAGHDIAAIVVFAGGAPAPGGIGASTAGFQVVAGAAADDNALAPLADLAPQRGSDMPRRNRAKIDNRCRN
jgi:hypothetical protein